MKGQQETQTAWLMLTKVTRQHGGNLGYDDNASEYYSWDSTVPNHAGPKPGHRIVIWDGEMLIGSSIIQTVETGAELKKRLRCPHCTMTKIKPRQQISPKFKCQNQNCRREFDTPSEEDIEVTTFRSYHQDFWQDLQAELTAEQLRLLCFQPKSQHSMRPLDWAKFKGKIKKEFQHNLQSADDVGTVKAGRKATKTFVRVGQRKFRKELFDQFGSICAFSGLNHRSGLDAAHLYSYASLEIHDYFGGLLLRKDLHRFFDLGLIAVDPVTLQIHLAPSLRGIPQYSVMHNTKLKVDIKDRTRNWLKSHWDEHKALIKEA